MPLRNTGTKKLGAHKLQHRSKAERKGVNKSRQTYRKQGRETSHRLNARTDRACR